jgi:hypothetical protein
VLVEEGEETKEFLDALKWVLCGCFTI